MTERDDTLRGLYKMYAEAQANDNIAFGEEIMGKIIRVSQEEEVEANLPAPANEPS